MKIKEGNNGIALTIGCVLCLVLNLAQAQIDLPAAINFDSDTAGNPPITGGQNQPSLLWTPLGSTILVQGSANGINTKPVVLSVANAGPFPSVITLFEPITIGIVRIEATVSFERLVQSIFLQTAVSSTGAIITQLESNGFGQIRAKGQSTPVGLYSANQPFRIRIDVNMADKDWSLTLDDEMNGFDDDAPVVALQFVNSPSAIPHISTLSASFTGLRGPTEGPASIAYDDIWICRDVCQFTNVVEVDIKPGNPNNSLNPRSMGVIAAAVLTSEGFDALQVDPDTARFGPAEAAMALSQAHVEDVDYDGDMDLVFHFKTQETGISCSVTEATLTGETWEGIPISGTDSVTTVGCQ